MAKNEPCVRPCAGDEEFPKENGVFASAFTPLTIPKTWKHTKLRTVLVHFTVEDAKKMTTTPNNPTTILKNCV